MLTMVRLFTNYTTFLTRHQMAPVSTVPDVGSLRAQGTCKGLKVFLNVFPGPNQDLMVVS